MNERTTIATESGSDIWLLEGRSLGPVLAQLRQARAAGEPQELAVGGGGSGRYGVRVESETAFIQIAGPLMRTVPTWLARWRQIFGDAVTGYDEIIEDLAEAVEDRSVKQIVLQVNSPGGSAFGVTEAREAVAAANRVKPVTAMIESYGASAAYELASQATKIIAEPNAIVGSIGTVIVLVDTSKAFEEAGYRTIVVSNGVHKGAGAMGAEITAEQIEPFQDIVDGMTATFVEGVAAGRGMSVADVRKLADGRIWVAADAKDVGLIDAVGLSATTNDTALAEGRSAGDRTKQEIETMAEKTGETPAADQVKTAGEQGETAGKEAAREQFTALQKAFPGEETFVGEQFAAGHNVEQAKAAFADVLTERNATLQAENIELQQAAETTAAEQKTAATEASKGADPIGSKAEGGQEGAGGFREAAKALAAEEKIPVSQAQSRISREQPELHAAYVKGLIPLNKTG